MVFVSPSTLMWASFIWRLNRRPSAAAAAAAAATMFQRSRSIGSCTNMDDKKIKVVAGVTLGGLEGSELKSVLSLVEEHLDLVGLRRALHKHLTSQMARKEKIRINCHTEATLEGFEDCEVETLRPCVDHYTKTAHVDPEKEPKDFKNVTYNSEVLYE